MDEKKKKRRNLITKLAICVCVAMMLFSGGYLLKNYLEDREGVNAYSSLEQYLAPPPSTYEPVVSASPDVTEAPAPVETTDTPEPSPEELESLEPEPEEDDDSGISLPVYHDNPAPDYWPVVDFDGLSEVNSDVVAWIISPGTNINYPVVQGADNDYYLNHLFTGEKSKAGAIFMDYRNRSDFTHRNTIIYGHHMRNRSMFWTLTQYRRQSYYNGHKTIRIVTPAGNYELQIVASYVASVDDNAWRVSFSSGETFMDWIDEARAKSDVATDVEVAEGDHMVTLSTCTYEFSNARYIVLCKLVAV